MKTNRHVWSWAVFFFASLWILGCTEKGAESGVAAGRECARNDLIAQCPQGTAPELEARTEAACNATTSISLEQDMDASNSAGEITHACVGTGTCRVACRLADPCRYGVSQISPEDGIICFEAPAGCGNDSCDAGETPENCPRDCAIECESGHTRCEGDRLQTCSLRGSWQPSTDCPSGQACRQESGSAAGCVDLALCGDGQLDTTLTPADPGYEECDDGNDSNDDACLNSCRVARCGDGEVHTGVEECDDANQSNEDGCRNDCQLARCGDGFTQPGEGCDDGNVETEVCDYGVAECEVCDAQCALVQGETSVCGDGRTDEANGEFCDDANTETEVCEYGAESCEVCDAQCVLVAGVTSICGDGRTDEANGETCDDANTETEVCEYGAAACEICDAQCTLAAGITSVCGDGQIDASNGEVCDDGNDSNADGCVNYEGQCVPAVCGDGHARISDDPDLDEDCDDGDRLDTNGCNRDCRLSEFEDIDNPRTGVAPLDTELPDGRVATYRDGLLERRDTDRFSYPVDCGLPGEFARCPDNDLPVARFRFIYFRETPLYGFYPEQDPQNREVLFQHECLPDENGSPVCFENAVTRVRPRDICFAGGCLPENPRTCRNGCVLEIDQTIVRQGIHVQTVASAYDMICPIDGEPGIIADAFVDDFCREVPNPTFRYTFERLD